MSDDELTANADPQPVAHLGQAAPHLLLDHLSKVGERARGNAALFSGDTFHYLLGLWHDFGKYNPKWQAYINHVAGPSRENTRKAIPRLDARYDFCISLAHADST